MRMSCGKNAGIGISAGLVLWLQVATVFALPPSKSKLGIHLIQSNTTGVGQIVAAHPRVIKILDTSGPMLDAARNYKAATPDGLVVLRVYTTRRYTTADNPAASASDFWNTVLAPAVNGLSSADRALIDYLEGPNECDSTPCWASLSDAQWFNDFWVALTPLIADAGFRPCAFSMPVGNPPGTQEEMQQRLAAIVPALRICKQRGGAWSYHAYTPNWDANVGTQWWYSLRYRQFYAYFAQAYSDLSDMPLILTEAGFDSGGSPTGSGWQANGTAEQYENWLTWWDGEIRQDSYVLGSTIFQIGSPATWPSFDLEPIAGWMAGYLDANGTPMLSCSPRSISRTVLQGGNATPASFQVTNIGYHTMSYTVASNVPWAVPSPTTGTSAGETDTIIVTFSTTGLSAGSYSGKLTVTASGTDASPQDVELLMTVQNVPVPGDLNGDQRVNGTDVDLFLPCITGAMNGPPASGCTTADLDLDGDVDQSDFAIMQRCISGNQLADPTCAD